MVIYSNCDTTFLLDDPPVSSAMAFILQPQTLEKTSTEIIYTFCPHNII